MPTFWGSQLTLGQNKVDGQLQTTKINGAVAHQLCLYSLYLFDLILGGGGV